MAAEFASYAEDVASALSPVGVQIAIGPLAPGGPAVCQCCLAGSVVGYCKAGASGSTSAEDFMGMMVAARPTLFSKATYFASHSYPGCCSCPLNSSKKYVALSLC